MPRSQAERLWLVGGALAALVLLVVGYFFLISPQRARTSDVNGQVDTARLQNLSLQQRVDTLRAENRNQGRYRAVLRQAQLALPATDGLPDFLRSLQSIGSATLTDVSAITVGQPAAASTPSATPAATASTPVPSASESPTTSTTPSPAAGSGIYAIPITAQVSGTASALKRFLTQLQSVQPRAVLITQLSLASPDGAGASSTLSLTMQAFVEPGSSTPQPTAAAQP